MDLIVLYPSWRVFDPQVIDFNIRYPGYLKMFEGKDFTQKYAFTGWYKGK